jgi:hypothetical protein
LVQQEPPVDHEEKRERRYLRKKQVRVRYGYESDRSIERAVGDGRLPRPTMSLGRFPLWAEDILDAHDARAARAQVSRRKQPAAKKASA